MTTQATHAYGERIREALKLLPPRQRNEVFAQHERAYRAIELMGLGLLDPTGLTAEGSAAVDALAQALGVEPESAPLKTKRSPKKDDSDQ